MRDKHIHSKESAVAEMKENSRAIISPEHASELIAPFVPFAKVKITKASDKISDLRGMAIDHKHRITWYGDKREGVAVDDMTQEIVRMLGEEPHTDMPYMGTGRNAEHVTKTNLAIICAKLKMETKECKEIIEWIFPKDRSKISKRFYGERGALKKQLKNLGEVV